jgi:hypothetical protein
MFHSVQKVFAQFFIFCDYVKSESNEGGRVTSALGVLSIIGGKELANDSQHEKGCWSLGSLRTCIVVFSDHCQR